MPENYNIFPGFSSAVNEKKSGATNLAIFTFFKHKIRLQDNQCRKCIKWRVLTTAVVPFRLNINVETITLGYISK